MARTAGLLGAVLAVLLALYFGVGHESQYVFDPAVMHRIAREAVAEGRGDADAAVAATVRKLRETYPKYMVAEPQWLFNNAGGAMGSMYVLHCSFSEYVIIFGTAVGTEGHTGRFLADDYFTMLHGEQWAHSAGSLKKEVYAPGEQHHLPRGTAKQYRCADGCWALEYARGNIASMLPFGVGDSLSSTFDLPTLGRTVWVSVYNMFYQLLVNGKV